VRGTPGNGPSGIGASIGTSTANTKQTDGEASAGEEGVKRHRSSSVRTRLADISGHLQSIVTEVQEIVRQWSEEPPAEATQTKDHLSLNELCALIPYKPQTVRNLKAQGVLRLGEHYLQRRRHCRVVYVWSAMQLWLRERQKESPEVEPFIPTHARSRKIR
jgi:hypothetical protein